MNQNNHVVTFIAGTDDPKVEMMNMELAKVVCDFLHTKYMGYLWRVNADIRGGIVNILCNDVSTEKGCTLLVAKLVDPVAAEKLVLKAGGEILERAKLHRGRMREDEVANAARDARGNIKNLN